MNTTEATERSKARTGVISNVTLNMRFFRNESKELGVWEKGGGVQPVMIY